MRPREGRVLRLAMPIKAMAQRFAFALLLGAAIALLVISKADLTLTERLRTSVADAVAPVLDAVAEPVSAGRRLVASVNDAIYLHEENVRLREENARLLQWQEAARRLEQDNARLRQVVQAGPDTAYAFTAARVIGDAGGPFVRTMLLNAGISNGVRKGQVVVGDRGLIGRVAEAGQRAARVLLLTDLNSHIPVAMENARLRGVLSGDNSDQPRLDYLAAGAQVQVGDRVLTSGDGGTFPPGLPVGQVVAVSDGSVRVQPLTDLGRLDYVRVLNYEQPQLTADDDSRTFGADPARDGARPGNRPVGTRR